MKLHFYLLEEPWNAEPYIRHEEVEAEEKPKTYTLKERPENIYVRRIEKWKIGCMLTDFGKKVILLERDDDKAKQIFIEHFNSLIDNIEKRIAEYTKIIKTISEWEE